MLIRRFLRALQAGRHAVETAPGESEAPRRTMAALVLGAGSGELLAAQALLRASKADRTVLITNSTNVQLYQLPGLITEFLPTGDWEKADASRVLYVRRRLSIVLSKWEVTRYAAFGPKAEQLMAEVAAMGGISARSSEASRATAA